ncbi:hypothetical protein KAI87_03415 [Myxococcota bacterium]|nr:hypothetical protein [Myxococcota bacterium]
MALFTLTSGALGAFWGGWIPAWDTDEGVTLDQSRQLGGAAFASSLAIVGSTALAQYTPFDPSRTRRTAFGAMGGGVLGAGIGLLLPKSLSPDHDRQLTVGLMQAGAIGGFTRAIFTEKKREYSSADRGLMAYMAASGMIHGSLIPHMWRNPNDDIPQDEIIGGAMVGASLGLGAARLRSKYIKSNASDIGEMFIMQSYGMATAWGMSELWDFDRRNQNNTLNGLSIGALTLGSFVAAHTEYGSRETTLTGITTLEGATAGAGLANLLIGQQYATSHQRASAAALGAGLGGFIGMGLSQTTQLTQDDAKESLAMALITGATSTSLALFLSDEYSNDEYMTAGSLGWLAGASAGLLLAPYTSYDASKNLNTILLATHGALAGAFLPEMIAPNENPNRTRRPGAIGLSAGTLTLAALGANHLDIINKEDILESMATAALLSNVTYNYGAIARTPFLNGERLQLAGFGYWGGAVLGMGVARFTEFDDSDRNFMALMGIHGALGGAFLPEIFDSREEALSSERGSGALFGAGAMSLLSMGLSQTNLLDEGDAFESIISAALFADLAYGFDAITKPNGSEGKRLQLTGHAYWGGALLGLLAAPFTTWDSESQEVAKLLTMQGAAGGVFLSELLDPDEPVSTERHVHGAMLGSGVYGLLGVGLAQTNLLEEDDVYESMYWSSLLAVGGYGYGKAKLVTQSQAQKNRFADMGWWAGSTLGLLAAPFTTHTEEAALWTLPIGGLGALAGYYMPTAIHGDSTSEMRKGAMTAGAAAGIFTLHLANQFIPIPDPERAAEASGFALLANTMTFGLGRAGLIGEGRTEALVNEGALAAGFIAGAIAAPYAEYSNKDLPLILALSSMGGVHGYGLPTAIGESDTQEQQGGAIFGASAATLLGYGLAQLHPLEQRSIPALTLNWLAGVGIGGGGAVLFNGNDEKGAAQAAQIGGLIGATLAYPFMPRTIFESENKSLLVFAPLWGAWHGYGLATAMGDDDSDSDLKTRHQGGFIFGTSLGLAAGIGLAPLVDLEAGDAVEASLYMGAAQLVGNGLGNLVFDTTQSRSFFETSLGIAGLGAGLLLAPHTEYETNDPLLVIGTTALGLAHSGLLKDVLPESSLGSSAASRMKLGAGLGLGAGFALSQFNNIDRIDLFEISLAMAAGDAVGFGLYEALSENHHRDDNGTRNALTLTTGLAGAALGFYGAVESDYSSSDRLLVAYGLAGGAWLGAWAPELLSYTDGDNHAGGLLFGMGAGALGAAVASQYFEYDRGDVAEILIGSSASSAMGAGAGLLLSSKDDNRPFVALMELGGIAGTLAFGALAPEVEHSSSDAWLGLLAASYGLYQGAGLSLLADADDDKVQGAMLLTGSAGLLVGGYFGRQLSLDQTDLLMLLAGSAWGVWTGVWTAAALEEANLQDSDSLLSVGMGTTAIATDLAILATSIAISEFVNMPPEQFAWISVGGGMGMVVGLLGSELTGEKIFGNRAGIALGSVSGLLAGAAITSLFDWSRPELVVPETITLSSSGDLPDWVPQVEMWFPQVGAAMPFENTNDYGSTPGSDAFMFSVVGYYQ